MSRIFAYATLSAIFILIVCPHVRSDELFPVSPQIEDNIRFWIDIYSTYSESEVVIHDSDYLDIVYEIVDLDDFYPHETDWQTKWRKVEEIKREYQLILLRLANKHTPIDTAGLTDAEKRVYFMWQGRVDPVPYRAAARNLRGQRGLAERFKKGLERSGRYMADLQKIFRSYELPTELCYLPHVESSFDYTAYSKMGAAGLWQFTRSTGRLFLKIDYTVDERFDALISTDAAARLLKKNYEELGSWPLAITAYNHGLSGMKRAKARLETDDLGVIVEKYRSRSFGFASKNFYAEFIAAKRIAERHLLYFGAIHFESPVSYQTFVLPDFMMLNDLAKSFNVEEEAIVALNPALRRSVTTSRRRIPRDTELRLPYREGFDPYALYEELALGIKYSDQIRDHYYRVERGDNLAGIARRNRTTVNTLMALNDIQNPHRIHEGQLLELPEPVQQDKTTVEKVEVADGGLQTMDPVAAIAQKETPVDLFVDATSIERPAVAGDTVRAEIIPPAHGPQAPPALVRALISSAADSSSDMEWPFEVVFEEPQTDWIIVQTEETVGHYADWLGVSVRLLREINFLSNQQDIHVGQRLRMVFNRTTPAEFHRKRLEYHRSIQEDFFTRYSVAGIEQYTIKAGDNIWDICQRIYDVPYWLVQRYNREMDLLHLHPGDRLVIPVVQALQDADQEENLID